MSTYCILIFIFYIRKYNNIGTLCTYTVIFVIYLHLELLSFGHNIFMLRIFCLLILDDKLIYYTCSVQCENKKLNVPWFISNIEYRIYNIYITSR